MGRRDRLRFHDDEVIDDAPCDSTQGEIAATQAADAGKPSVVPFRRAR